LTCDNIGKKIAKPTSSQVALDLLELIFSMNFLSMGMYLPLYHLLGPFPKISILFSYTVVAAVRSSWKGQRLEQRYTDELGDRLSTVVVEDISKEGAFDEAVQTFPFDFVIHVASPFYLFPKNPEEDMLKPAISGTLGLLQSVKTYAPSVNRVIVTSSFAAMENPTSHPPVYSEECWNPITYEQALDPSLAYFGSKKLAEKAAWAFMLEEKPSFTLTTICPPLIYGPVMHHLDTLNDINTSNEFIRDVILGKFQEHIPPTPLYLWVDVRDVAHVHIQALDAAGAESERFLVVAGHCDNKAIIDVIREEFPQLAPILPPKILPGDLPLNVYQYDDTKVTKILGLRYHSLRDSIKATVATLLDKGDGLEKVVRTRCLI
jgi:nucleoside-diphosphate-sugar epimerase